MWTRLISAAAICLAFAPQANAMPMARDFASILSTGVGATGQRKFAQSLSSTIGRTGRAQLD
jgi:hypothetical protein